MSRKTNFLLFTTSFIDGLTAGFLLSPQKGTENRAWLAKNAEKAGRWATLEHYLAKQKGTSRLDRLRKSIQRRIHQNIPNLYEATETIPLSKKM
ncbi:hypothetical protein [Fodinibius sp. Rm-B-1B1-1]|uniref:hypothetical protein n=1 Tax=Fodinibius alkaliphilus TaxID=3140241 RepID=UPI00315AA012